MTHLIYRDRNGSLLSALASLLHSARIDSMAISSIQLYTLPSNTKQGTGPHHRGSRPGN